MKTQETIAISVVGNVTGRSYSGSFTVKTVMTQRDVFSADLMRRQIIGPSPENTPPIQALQLQAYMYAQVNAHTVDAPKFWKDSDGGLDLPDGNVVVAIYEEILKAEEAFAVAIKEDSKKALKELAKKPTKKKPVEDEEENDD